MDGNIRVRMAPSPTGFLHIGTARTTLFNWLFARSQGGTFILRIEDTDTERSTKAFETNILAGLHALGFDWDEGPDIGGPYGPYRQSERIAVYQQYLERLLEDDKAYRCFCTKEELQAQDQEMASRGEVARYRGTCAHLDKADREQHLARKKPYVIRLRMPAKKIVFNDMIRGKVTFDTSLFGDVIIAKTTTEPLYNFAVVVDDYEMKITHVIRGEEHLSNTPKQIVLQETLGFPAIRFAHLPLILDADRTKLSKRKGTTTSVDEYFAQGYIPEALINFMALLGWHPPGDRELFTLDELVKEFSIERVQKTGAIFNAKRLNWLNNYYLRKKPMHELLAMIIPVYEKNGLVHQTKPGTYANRDESDTFDANYLEKVIGLVLERIQKLTDVPDLTDFFFTLPSYEPKLLQWREAGLERIQQQLERILETMQKIDEHAFTKETLTEQVGSLYGTDRGEILWPLRVALSGKQFSPGPFEIADILEKKRCITRVTKAIKIISL